MNRKEFETELHEIDPKLILTVLAHQGADEIDYYDGNQKIYKVFDFEKGLYDPKGSVFLSVNQFNKLTNLLFKAQALVRGRYTFDDMQNTTVLDNSHTAKQVSMAMTEVQKAYKKTGYKENNYDNPFKEYTDKLAETLLEKNTAYGDSFSQSVDDYGLKVIGIRLSDKYNRIKHLVNAGSLKENDESIEDTLLDTAGYAILGLKYLKEHENEIDN